VPESVKDGLSGYNFKRLGGSDRYETNLQILSEGGDIVPWFASDIIVCSGTGFADSLSAAATGDPIMLVKGNSLTAGQMQYLQTLSSAKKLFITVVGGTGAVSKNIFTQLKAYGDVYRVGGKDRYETSQLFAEHYFDAITSSAVLAFGGNFPDGLCGGSLANSMGAPLILTANGKTSAAENYVRGNGISYGAVLGGTTLISDASAKAIFDVSEDSNVVAVK
jgi:putative cell wall-binding protein